MFSRLWSRRKVKQLLLRARFLRDKFEQSSETRYIDEAIVLDRQALDICPLEHPQRAECLTQLAIHIWDRYNQLGGIENINIVTELDREALRLHPPGHPDRSESLINLAIDLATRYQQLGAIEDLNEAIVLGREALALCQSTPERPSSLINLALNLHTRYMQLGRGADLCEAIILTREALTLCPPGHLDRFTSLLNLAASLFDRYKQLGSVEDLSEAISLDQSALALCPPGHLHRSHSLNNLAFHLFARHKHVGTVEDLSEATTLNREALALHPPGHYLRPCSLNNLAENLFTHYMLGGGLENLSEAIVLNREAVGLCPPGNMYRSLSLHNLGDNLFTRYAELGAVEDLHEAIDLSREALVLRPLGHPQRSATLENFAKHLSARYKHLGKAEDREEVFSLYSAELARGGQTLTSNDLSAAKTWINTAEEFKHPTTLLAYETALRLLVQHLAALPSLPQHFTVLKTLSSSLAIDAFSACLRNRSPMSAIELLEQGRGVFWTQLTRLRSPLDDVVTAGPSGRTLAAEYTRLTSLIRNTLQHSAADQHDQVYHLNQELGKVVSNIRSLPGLSRFLLPSLFSELRRAASDGPVIIVNASQYGCDVVIVSVHKDPVHIPLSITKGVVGELASDFRVSTERAKNFDETRDLGMVLRELWDQIVSPIADTLRLTYPLKSRIWWCPTAEFSLLPLHAAGPYRKGEKNFADLYISSYTPTLNALIRARQPAPSTFDSGRKRFIAIGQANATGTNKLHSVGTELANIRQQIDGLATFTCIEDQDSCISRVTEELNKNEWVHLACHGIPNSKQPFESAFALRDGHLTIHRITQCELQNAEFAYLSACHTTAGDEESPDEVIHLAAAMQFAGFRSVIGTMWAVDDAETNKITSVFYKHVSDVHGRIDHTRAAHALWKTMRTVHTSLDQRILYVHLGV